jgi:hypothetical protein
MRTPTDTELLDYLEGYANNKENKWRWVLQHKFGCVFLDRNDTSGTETAREAIIKHMEKSKETDLTI